LDNLNFIGPLKVVVMLFEAAFLSNSSINKCLFRKAIREYGGKNRKLEADESYDESSRNSYQSTKVSAGNNILAVFSKNTRKVTKKAMRKLVEWRKSTTTSQYADSLDIGEFEFGASASEIITATTYRKKDLILMQNIFRDYEYAH